MTESGVRNENGSRYIRDGGLDLPHRRAGAPFFSNYQFEDAIRTEAQMDTYNTKTDDQIRDSVYKKAQELDVPVTREQIKVQRTGPSRRRLDQHRGPVHSARKLAGLSAGSQLRSGYPKQERVVNRLRRKQGNRRRRKLEHPLLTSVLLCPISVAT